MSLPEILILPYPHFVVWPWGRLLFFFWKMHTKMPHMVAIRVTNKTRRKCTGSGGAVSIRNGARSRSPVWVAGRAGVCLTRPACKEWG